MPSKHRNIPLERPDPYGSLRLMTIAEGYVMARRKGCRPFVASLDEWMKIGTDANVLPLRIISRQKG